MFSLTSKRLRRRLCTYRDIPPDVVITHILNAHIVLRIEYDDKIGCWVLCDFMKKVLFTPRNTYSARSNQLWGYFIPTHYPFKFAVSVSYCLFKNFRIHPIEHVRDDKFLRYTSGGFPRSLNTLYMYGMSSYMYPSVKIGDEYACEAYKQMFLRTIHNLTFRVPKFITLTKCAEWCELSRAKYIKLILDETVVHGNLSNGLHEKAYTCVQNTDRRICVSTLHIQSHSSSYFSHDHMFYKFKMPEPFTIDILNFLFRTHKYIRHFTISYPNTSSNVMSKLLVKTVQSVTFKRLIDFNIEWLKEFRTKRFMVYKTCEGDQYVTLSFRREDVSDDVLDSSYENIIPKCVHMNHTNECARVKHIVSCDVYNGLIEWRGVYM